MRYLMLYKPGHDANGPPSPDTVAKMGAFIQELMQAGVLIDTGGLESSATGTRVTIDGSAFTVVDGPFAETKELIAGYAIMDFPTKAAAVDTTRRFLALMGEGTSEIRPMHGPQGV